MADFIDVAADDEIQEGVLKGVEVDGRRVVLARVEGQVHAIGGICTHEYAHLDDGDLEGFDVVCSLHFAAFDLRTGQVTAAPADKPEPVYDVRVERGRVLVSREPRGA